jgi:hypothetical protein
MRSLNLAIALSMATLCASATLGAEAECAQPAEVCPAPVSTCGNEDGPERDCPPGYRCSCVPSCPGCRDCATQVCLADPTPECRTACDCDPGLGCFDGQCIAGFAPVFCCDSAQCPSGEQCQHGDGRMDRCPSKSRDCERRLEKVSHRTDSFVGHAAGCRNDEDCVRIETSTRCRGTCGAWVNRQFATRVERFVGRLDQRYCSVEGEYSCTSASPRCRGEVGACIAGQCTGLLPPAAEEQPE